MTDQELLAAVRAGKTEFSYAEHSQLLMIETQMAPGPLRKQIQKLNEGYQAPPDKEGSNGQWSH